MEPFPSFHENTPHFLRGISMLGLNILLTLTRERWRVRSLRRF